MIAAKLVEKAMALGGGIEGAQVNVNSGEGTGISFENDQLKRPLVGLESLADDVATRQPHWLAGRVIPAWSGRAAAPSRPTPALVVGAASASPLSPALAARHHYSVVNHSPRAELPAFR